MRKTLMITLVLLMSAAWLRQMGHHDVYVVDGGLGAVRAGHRCRAVDETAPSLA